MNLPLGPEQRPSASYYLPLALPLEPARQPGFQGILSAAPRLKLGTVVIRLALSSLLFSLRSGWDFTPPALPQLYTSPGFLYLS